MVWDGVWFLDFGDSGGLNFEKNMSIKKSGDFRKCVNVGLKHVFKPTFWGAPFPPNQFFANVGLICAFLRKCPLKGASRGARRHHERKNSKRSA